MLQVRNNRRFDLIKISLLIAVTLIFFSSGGGFLFSRLIDDTSYYGHGPFVILAFIWTFRKRFRESSEAEFSEIKKSNLSGFIIIYFSLLVYLIGLWGFINTFQSTALYLFVLGNCVLFFGRDFVRKNPGIFVYLLLAIPLPKPVIDLLTFDLRLLASFAAESILSVIYPSTARLGNILNINGDNIVITPACSGLQNLIVMISMIYFLALSQSKRSVRIFDYIIAVPAALLSNILRIIIVCILAVSYDREFALVDWHDEIGIVIFLPVFIIIAAVNESPFKKTSASERTVLSAMMNKAGYINTYLIIMSLLLLISFLIPEKFNPDKKIDNILLNESIPKIINGWHSRDYQFENNYYDILGTRDIMMRSYEKTSKGPGNEIVYVFITRSKQNRKFAHTPEPCLEGEGYHLLYKNDIDLPVDNKKIPCNRMLFRRDLNGLLVYYWFNSDKKNYRNVVSLYFSFLFMENRRSGGSMIRLSAVVNPDNPDAGDKALLNFASEALPEILKGL